MGKARLENWRFMNGCLYGDVFDDEKRRFEDGSPIVTSPVIELRRKDGGLHFEAITKNTVYELVNPFDADAKIEEISEVMAKAQEVETFQNKDAQAGTASLGVMGLLGVLFVGLKLTGHIDWSWALVTLPFWAGLVIFAGVFAFVFTLHLLTRR